MAEFKSLSMTEGSVTYEDFTTFTEVDIGADRIQKTANHIDHNANMDETTYLYKDYGVGNFGNFTHKIKVRMASGDNSITTYTWMLANELNDAYHLYNQDKDFIGIKMSRTGGSYSIYVYESDGGVLYYDNWASAVVNTWYYIKIVKSGTSLNAYIYSDADYTILEDTLTLTLKSDYSFRYLYGCNTWNNASGYNSIMDIENLDLGVVWSYIIRESGSEGWKALEWESIYEDFTTWVETDPQGKLTVTANQINAAGVTRNGAECRVYKDYGVDNFNALNIEFSLYNNSSSLWSSHASAVGFSNTITNIAASASTNIWCMVSKSSGGDIYRIYLLRGAWASGVYYACSANTTYYCKLERSASSDTVTLKIYSDAERTNLLTTLTRTGFGTASRYRYLYGWNMWKDATSGTCYADIKNLEIK